MYWQNNYFLTGNCPVGTIPYAIRPRDTFWIIAQRLGVSVNDIVALNPGVDPRFLFIGQRICVPAPPMIPPLPRLLCTMPLLPVEADQRVGGSVWIREDEFSVTGYSTLFAATYLPEPETLGDFDAYIGSITIAQPPPEAPIVHSVILNKVERPVQQVTWAGTRIFPEGPAPRDIAEIRPYHINRDIAGPAVLRNTFQQCT